MLKELIINNLALIEKLHISFADGLSVLTGETGAGKSIILQAIHLLYGGRASTSWIRTGSEQTMIEAFFDCAAAPELLEKVREKGFASDDDLIIKRILDREGRSRYYLNGQLATARVAGEITEHLVSVASQHDHQHLLLARNHLDFIDSIGNLWPKRRDFTELFEKWCELRDQCQALRQRETEKEQQRDLLTYQLNEIQQAAINQGEDEALIREKKQLKSADDLKKMGWRSFQLLGHPVSENLIMASKDLERMAALDQDLAPLAEEVAGLGFQLEDHLARLRAYLENIPDDPARLEIINSRIDLLQKLKRKYGPSLDQVLAFAEKAATELDELDIMDQRLGKLEKERAVAETQLLSLAADLSASRKKAALKLQRDMVAELQLLCFDQARFEAFFPQETTASAISPEILSRTGLDRPEFLFSANQGEELKPLAKIASGGELSRLMLALKCILARKDRIKTVIFDEVDAGLGGKAAEAVADKVRELALHHQVLCITHLPQIAAAADEHFHVVKKVTGERTMTAISRLLPQDRVHELARMLKGDAVTPKTLDYAKELMERNVIRGQGAGDRD